MKADRTCGAAGNEILFRKADKPIQMIRHGKTSGAGSVKIRCLRFHTPSCAGFTLMEVLVAVSILAIVLTGVFRLHAQSISMNQSIRFYTMAPQLAQAKMSELERTASDSGTEQSGDFGDLFDGYSWRASVQDVESEELGTVSETLKCIDVTVLFHEGQFTYALRNYVMLSDEP